MALLSMRAAAKALGFKSDNSIRAAVTAGRITLVDGKVDIDQARAALAANTDPAFQRDPAALSRGRAEARGEAPPDDAGGGGPDPEPGVVKRAPTGRMAQLREADMAIRVADRKFLHEKKKGQHIARSPALAAVTTLARGYRDGMMDFTDRQAPEVAAELGEALGVEIPTHTLHVILERRIRKHIVEVLDEIVVDLPRE